MRRLLSAVLAGLIASWPAAGVAAPPPFSPAPLSRVLKSGIVPSVNFRQAIAKAAAGGTVNVCIVGDSTSFNQTPAGVASYDGLWFLLQRRLIEDNPGVTFNFLNYAVPGSTMGEYLSTVAPAHQVYVTPTWLYDTSIPWKSYVQNAHCDVVFTNWGVNDAQTLLPSTINSAIGMSNWTPIPDLVYITGKSANPAAGAPYSGSDYQAGYLANASLFRSIVKSGSYGISNASVAPGLIDIGRYFQMAVNGIDPVEQFSTAVNTSAMTGISTFPFALPPSAGGDIDVRFTAPGALSALQSASPAASLILTIGAIDGSAGAVTMQFSFPIGGVNATFNYGSINVTKTKTISGADLTVEVAVKENFLTVVANGVTAWQQMVTKPTAPFIPTFTAANFPAGKSLTITSYSYGTPRPYNRILTADQTYGPVTPGATTGAVNGGNGINHDTSIALNAVDWNVLQATDFAFAGLTPNRLGTASVVTASPATGATVAAAQGVRTLKLTPAAALSSLTVTFPPNPKDNDPFEVVSTQTVSSLTGVASATPGGQAVNPGAATSAAPGAGRRWLYDLASKTWLQAQ